LESVGAKIRKIRKENKDTLEELARKIDYDFSNLSKVERGKYGASIDLLKRITEVYGLSPAYFFDADFTEAERNLIQEDNLDPSNLKEKYHFVIDGVEATEEEIMEAIRMLRYVRGKSQD
jgi:transcriptional regulator with XRE-family HTH domain